MATSTRKPSVRGCGVTDIGKDQRGSPQGWARFCTRSLLTKDGSYVRQISREQEIVNAFLARSQHEPRMLVDTGVDTPQALCKSETSCGAPVPSLWIARLRPHPLHRDLQFGLKGAVAL